MALPPLPKYTSGTSAVITLLKELIWWFIVSHRFYCTPITLPIISTSIPMKLSPCYFKIFRWNPKRKIDSWPQSSFFIQNILVFIVKVPRPENQFVFSSQYVLSWIMQLEIPLIIFCWALFFRTRRKTEYIMIYKWVQREPGKKPDLLLESTHQIGPKEIASAIALKKVKD